MATVTLAPRTWAFAYETSSHSVRLMLSGLFDEFPEVQVILGRMGEGMPFMLPRLQHRLAEQREGEKGGKAKRRPGYYFANHFYITTSGHFPTKSLIEDIKQIGADRVLFRWAIRTGRWIRLDPGSTTFASTVKPSGRSAGKMQTG
jgi:gamma-resorcylate decarboxylase